MVSTEEGFKIVDKYNVWFIEISQKTISMLKNYLYFESWAILMPVELIQFSHILILISKYICSNTYYNSLIRLKKEI